MVDFKIKRGHSSVLFSSPGVINPRLIVEEGCWYLCTDTADLFLGVLADDGTAYLKRINEVENELSNDELQKALNKLQTEVSALAKLDLFQKIENESDLPTDFNSSEFNPNVTYYIPKLNGKVTTYIFDEDAACYMCTSSVDESIIKPMVSSAIEQLLEVTLSSTLDVMVPQTVKSVIETAILCGGDAS